MIRIALLAVLTALPPAQTYTQLESALPDSGLAEELLLEQLQLPEEPQDDAIDHAGGDSLTGDGWHAKLRARFTGRTELPRGFYDGSFPGSPNATLIRCDAGLDGTLAGGVLLRKDPGEERIDDLLAWNITLKHAGPVSQVILGDFVVEAGLGLVLWGPYGLKKGADVLAPSVREQRGLSPALSADLLRPFRGAALAFTLGEVGTTIWWSRRTLPATTGEDDPATISGFYTAGLFRTDNERSKRRGVSLTVMGGRVEWKRDDRLRCGGTVMVSGFSKPLAVGPFEEHPVERIVHAGADLDVRVGPLRLMGESVVASPGGVIAQMVMTGRMCEGLEGVISVRTTGEGYYALQASPFGEGSTLARERGVYAGLRMKPMDDLSISWFADRFVFPDGKNGSRFPTDGAEQQFRVEYTGIGRLRAILQVFRGIAGVNEPGDALSGVRSRLRHREKFRFEAGIRVDNRIQLRSRFEYVSVRKDPARCVGNGVMLLQQCQLSFHERFRLQLRVVVFRTDSYESGFGVVDLDLPGAMALPVMYGSGVRWTVVMKSQLTSGMSLAVKYSEHVRDDVRKPGTGMDQLPSNRDCRFGFQLDVRY